MKQNSLRDRIYRKPSEVSAHSTAFMQDVVSLIKRQLALFGISYSPEPTALDACNMLVMASSGEVPNTITGRVLITLLNPGESEHNKLLVEFMPDGKFITGHRPFSTTISIMDSLANRDKAVLELITDVAKRVYNR